MSLKFTEKLCVMTMKNNAEFEEKLARRFKIDKRNLTNFESTTQKSQKFALSWALYKENIQCLS